MAEEKPLNLVYWIRGGPQAPKPVKLRVTTADGAKLVAIKPKAPRPWAEAARAVEALAATRVECLDDKGEVLRVVNLEAPPDEPGETVDDTPAPKTARESELVLLAKLIAGAYRDGAAQHAAFADDAYKRLVELCQTAFARLEGLEKAWTRLLNSQVRQASRDGGDGDGEGPSGDMLQQMLMQFMAGAAQKKLAEAGVSVPTAPAANGAPAKTEGDKP